MTGPEVHPCAASWQQRFTCPDHPGPLDDARNHVCRLRPAKIAQRECGCSSHVEPHHHDKPGDPGVAVTVVRGESYDLVCPECGLEQRL